MLNQLPKKENYKNKSFQGFTQMDVQFWDPVTAGVLPISLSGYTNMGNY